jgi:hypothetical protein
MAGDRDLNLQQAQAYLARKGVDWTMSHLKAQMACGKMRSVKGESIKLVRQSDLDRVIRERRSKQKQA